MGMVVLSCGGSHAEPQEPEQTGQSMAEAMHLICEVDRLAKLTDSEDPLELGQQRQEWLNERIKNPDAIYFRTVLRVQGPDEQAKQLREQASQVGVHSCPLADRVARDGMM
jgi:hypothetical protein